MRQALVLQATRDGYDISQAAGKAMTIGELKMLIDDWQDDDLLILSHDNGYTFGSAKSEHGYIAEEDSEGYWSRV